MCAARQNGLNVSPRAIGIAQLCAHCNAREHLAPGGPGEAVPLRVEVTPNHHHHAGSGETGRRDGRAEMGPAD